MPGINVSFLLHGLFFMTQEGDNLRVYAPNIPGHHFVGGTRGKRTELTSLQDLTQSGLRGKVDPKTGQPNPDPNTDIDGSIMRFPTGDVGALKPPDDPKFKGTILLPWPLQIIGLRTSGIMPNVGPDTRTNIGKRIRDNASAKGSSTFAVVALLQYTLPSVPSTGGISQLNIHYYLQPCKVHDVKAVNVDLGTARYCFTNAGGFDLQMFSIDPPATPATGNSAYGTTREDELALDEDDSPDIKAICTSSKDNVSPANCPIFFVGP